MVWIWKSSRSLVPLLPQLVSPAFSPLYDERLGWPPTSSSVSSSTTPTGLLNFPQPGVCSHTHHEPTMCCWILLRPPPQSAPNPQPLQMAPITLCSGHLPNHPASQNENIQVSITGWTISQLKRCKTNSFSSEDRLLYTQLVWNWISPLHFRKPQRSFFAFEGKVVLLELNYCQGPAAAPDGGILQDTKKGKGEDMDSHREKSWKGQKKECKRALEIPEKRKYCGRAIIAWDWAGITVRGKNKSLRPWKRSWAIP